MSKQSRAIEIIYTFFIGILIAVFVGVGIAAFYPEPKSPETPAELKVYRAPIDSEEKTEQTEELMRVQKQYDAEIEIYQKDLQIYNRNVSMIALAAAVLILVISLTLLKELLVLADGLLLGGVITLLYSVVRVFGSGDDKIRFVVVAVGLAVSLALGYIKFIQTPQKK